jgi:hypothetical protein
LNYASEPLNTKRHVDVLSYILGHLDQTPDRQWLLTRIPDK